MNVSAGADGKNPRVTPFMTGFMDSKQDTFWGRPAYILQMPDGALLVSDEQLGGHLPRELHRQGRDQIVPLAQRRRSATGFGRRASHSVVALAAVFFCAGAIGQLQDRLKNCAACHGEGGNSTTAGIPSLAGQPHVFTETQLILFREGVRPQEPMSTLMRGVSDKEISALAAYYAAQKLVPAKAPRDGVLARRGQELAKKMNCGSCHLSDFSGREQMARLAGQREDYLDEAMRAYRDNRRPGSDTMMAGVLFGVSDAEIKALAHFLNGSR